MTTKRLTLAVLAIAITLGFVACNINEESPKPASGGNTYVGVRIAFPGATEPTRALPDDFNSDGVWAGRDKIEKITVYVVNEEEGTVDYTTFTETSFSGITAEGLLNPTLAVKATAGANVKAYAVVNDFSNKTGAELQKVGATEFDSKFKTLQFSVTTVADVAKTTTESGTTKDVVMMTNELNAATITVAPNITKEQAMAGTSNQAKISVSRVASRGIVTLKPDVKGTPIKVKNFNGKDASTITLQSVTYGVGQSNKVLNNVGKTDARTPEPVYNYNPATSSDWRTRAKNIFDFSGVAESTRKNLQEATDKSNANLKLALAAEDFSKFVLPVTHAGSEYVKGNTTYFEIRCTFTVDQIDGAAPSSTNPQTVYMGMQDGKFYSTREKAKAVKGQKSTQFKDGVMKYVLWLNPDQPYGGATKITQSPTVRNQIYHAHITGFKEIGVPYNPINPDDPDNPTDPNNPENPIKPEDPLQTEDTYMSVSVTVLKWGIHSYDVNIGNDY